MTKTQISGEQEASIAVSLSCSEKENVTDYKAEHFEVNWFCN